MGRKLLLARSNIRKAKGQTAAIIVLVLLSSLMMNLWLMLAMDYKENFNRYHDRLNDGHVTLAAYPDSENFREFISDTLEASSDVTEFNITDAFCTSGSLSYGGGEVTSRFVMLEKETALSRNVGKFEITEEGSFKSGIYLPMLYGTGDNYSVGDMIEITLGSEKVKYTVCGFFNTTMLGSHNCAMLAFLLTEDKFEELSEKASVPRSTCISIRIKDKMQGEGFEVMLKEKIDEKFPELGIISNYYEMITVSRYVSQMICSAIVSVMAFLTALIAIVVISSNVINYIRENMRNLGAMKAIGYTSRQLISALITQFSGIALITVIVGISLSYCIFPAVNEMMIAQTGIPYAVKFLPLPCLITIFFIVGAVTAAVYCSAKRIKKTEPITALRQGIATHNFKKNHIPLDRTTAPLNIALALKTAFSVLKQNITMCITMLVLSLILVFSGVIFENAIIDMQPFIDLFAGETADSLIKINIEAENEFLNAMESDSRVEKIYQYTQFTVGHVGGISLVVTVSDDFSKMNNQSVIIEGRFPKYDNETVIAAKYAKETALDVGDEISLKLGEHERKYIISGLSQDSNNLGKDCMLTREGYEKIGSLQDVGYFIYLTADTDIDDFNSRVSERFGSSINATLNYLSILEGTGSMYVLLLTVIVAAVLILSCIVIIFVMYLLVRTLLNSKKRDYGILKALGFTTKQLILQTAISFMPSVIIFEAVGIFISSQIINPLLSLFFSGIGIVKCTFAVPVRFNIIAGIGLILFAFAAACLMSLRVKRIAPRELLTGE